MVDRIAYTSVLGNRLVGEVDFAVLVNGNVLEEGVTCDSVVDVGLALLVEVDNLGIHHDRVFGIKFINKNGAVERI